MTPRRIATILDRRKHISTYPLFLSNGLRKIQDRVRKSWENDGRRDYITNTLPGRLAKKKIRLVCCTVVTPHLCGCVSLVPFFGSIGADFSRFSLTHT